MMTLQNWKSVGYVVAIFVAGGIAGASIALSMTHHKFPGPRDMQRFLTHRLDLTPEQVQKVDPIVDKLNTDLQAVRRDARQRASKLIDDADTQIASFLTPDQKAKMQQLQRARREHMMHHRWHPRHRENAPEPSSSPAAGLGGNH